MKDTKLEQQFEKVLFDRCAAAKLQCGCGCDRFLQAATQFGGVGTIKGLIRKGGASENFDALQKAQRLELSIEALVAESKYAVFFSDEEVDHCLALLCESGYYQIR